MRILLDTCVLSEMCKTSPSLAVQKAIENFLDRDLYISVITLGEIAKGIALLQEGTRKQNLQTWFMQIEQNYAGRILQIDNEIASLWGEITAKCQKQGLTLGVADGLIAATALRHGLYVMTRNVKDFEITGVLLCNPFEDNI